MKMRGRWFGFLAALLFAVVIGVLLPEEAQASCVINSTSFPDAEFREYVKGFDKNKDGTLDDLELGAVKAIGLRNLEVTTLKGLNNFKGLQKLDIRGTGLSGADISDCLDLIATLEQGVHTTDEGYNSWERKSGNQITHYIYADFGTSMFLGTLINEANFGSTGFADYVREHFDWQANGLLSTGEALTPLEIDISSGGYGAIKVDVFKNLTKLNCSGNSLTSLNVRNNPKLTHLDCSHNELTSLFVQTSDQLRELRCEYNQLTELNVRGLTRLTLLHCQENGIKKLELNNEKLAELRCEGNPFGTMPLYCREDTVPKLYHVCMTGAMTVNTDSVVFQNEANTEYLKVPKTLYNQGSVKLVSVNEAHFPDPTFRAFVNGLTGNKDILDAKTVRETKKLEIMNDAALENVQGIRYLAWLEEVWLSDCNNLTEADLSGLAHLVKATVVRNAALSVLKVQGCKELVRLSANKNALTTISVTGNTKLEYLDVSSNQIIGGFSVEKNTALTQLDLGNNPQITALNVTKNKALTSLSAWGCAFKLIDVSQNTALTALSVYNNKLKELDVSQNTALVQLSCYGNQLTELDLLANPDLVRAVTNGRRTEMTDPLCVEYLVNKSSDGTYPAARLRVDPGVTLLVEEYKPVISLNPEDVTVKEGEEAVFTVRGKGGNLSYAWYFRKAGETAWTPAGGKSEKLTVTAGTALDGAQYMCTVSNSKGSTDSKTAKLTVEKKETPVTPPSPGGLIFVDVPASAPYYEALEWAFGNGIVKGTDKTHFSPNKGTTRGEFCTMLWRLNGKPALTEEMKADNPFTDIKPGKGHGTAVLWCADRGIITGYKAADGTRYFNPGGKITRTNMIVMLYKMAKRTYGAEAVKAGYSGSPYKDIKASNKNIAAYKWAYVKKISRPSNGMFEPAANCLRWHLVFFLYRYNNVYHVK